MADRGKAKVTEAGGSVAHGERDFLFGEAGRGMSYDELVNAMESDIITKGAQVPEVDSYVKFMWLGNRLRGEASTINNSYQKQGSSGPVEDVS